MNDFTYKNKVQFKPLESEAYSIGAILFNTLPIDIKR